MPIATNTASVEYDADGSPVWMVSNTATYTILEESSRSLGTVTKSPETATIMPGIPLDITITIDAPEDDQSNMYMRDVIDSNLTLVADSVNINGEKATLVTGYPNDSGEYSYQGGTLTVNVGTVPAGETVITFQVEA